MTIRNEEGPSGKDPSGKQFPENSSGTNFNGSSAGAGNPVTGHAANGAAFSWTDSNHSLVVSTFKSVVSDPREQQYTLAEFADLLKSPGPTRTRKNDLALLKLAAFGTKRTGGSNDGSLRNDANVTSVSGVEGDYDGEQVSISTAEARLRKAGIGAILTSSPSYSPEAPRWRVLCPISQAANPTERKRLAARLNAALGGILAAESFALSQSFYFGRVEGVPYDVRLIDGKYIDRIDGLPEVYRNKTKEKNATAPDLSVEDMLARVPPRIADVIRNGPPEKDYDGNDTDRSKEVYAVISYLIERSWTENDIYKVFSQHQGGIGKRYEGDRFGMLEDIVRCAGRARKHGSELTDVFAGPEVAKVRIDELEGEPYQPPDVIEGFMPRDAGSLSAPGETGKSTLAIYTAAHILLGWHLFGHKIAQPGAALFVSAEDDRETIAGRLNWICKDLGLRADRRQQIAEGFYIEDVSAKQVRFLTVREKSMQRSRYVDELIDKYRAKQLSLVIIDPVSLLGPGEETGNDGMAEMMRTCRYVSRELGAAVWCLHHVSKDVARNAIVDQYAGRGGSALSDNGRFTFQLLYMTNRNFEVRGEPWVVPYGITDEQLQDPGALVLVQHKHSYRKKRVAPIILFREGFGFTHFDGDRGIDDKKPGSLTTATLDLRNEADEKAVIDFLRHNLAKEPPQRLGKDALKNEADIPGIKTRARQRMAVDRLLGDKKALVEADLPDELRSTKRTKYITFASGPDLSGQPEPTSDNPTTTKGNLEWPPNPA